jgi:protein O-GlcNAc transferase
MMQLNNHEKEALKSFNKQSFSKAVVESKKAISKNKNSQIAQLILGLALLNLQKYKEAEIELNKAIRNKLNSEVAYKNLAKAQLALGKYQNCEDSLISALRIKPKWVECLFDLAQLKQTQGQTDKSEAIYREILLIDPLNAGVYNNLAVLLRAQQRYEDALTLLIKALEINPKYIHALINISGVLNSLSRPSEAQVYLTAGLELEPNNNYLLVNLGDSLRISGSYLKAMEAYEKAISIKSNESSAYNGLGQLLSAMKDSRSAFQTYKKAIALGLHDPAIYSNLGALYAENSDYVNAEEMYIKALDLNPKFPACLSNLGIVYTKQGKYQKAIDAHDKAININSSFIAAHNNKANLLGELGKHHESIKIFEQIIKSGYANDLTYINMASAYYNLGAINNSIICSERAIEMGSKNAEAFNNLGLAQKDWGLFDDAIKNFEYALSIDGDAKSVYNNLLFTVNYHPKLTAEEIFEYYRKYGEVYPIIEFDDRGVNRRVKDKRIKIGYVSADFKKHACAQFIFSYIKGFDLKKFEIYIYAENIVEDQITDEFKTLVSNWRKTSHINDDEMVELIREDGIDILVDLSGHTKGNRLKVFAKKPAPVSVTCLGYGYTTGLKVIDYIFACNFTAPKGSEHLFSEKVWRLPYLGCYSNTSVMPEVTPLPLIKNNHITFCTLSRSIRINDGVIETWAEVLRSIPDSKLIINSSDYADDVSRDRIIKKFIECGVNPESLTVGFESPPWTTLQKSDISLDCFPHNSGTTLFESLYMGVPYITLSDRPAIGSLGGGLLVTAGYPEWISRSRSEYVSKAVELASNIDQLCNIRRDLRAVVSKTSLFNQPKFIGEVEAEYKKMWEVFCCNNV